MTGITNGIRSLMPMMAAAVAWLLATAEAGAGTVTPTTRGFVVETETLSAVVADGAVVGLTNLKTGEVHAAGGSVPAAVPAGIGLIGGQIEAMAQLHTPLARLKPAPRTFPSSVLACYRIPAATCSVEFRPLTNGGSTTWKGLTDGTRFYPEDSITVTARIDAATGTIALSAEGRAAEGGVFGIQVPIVNLHGDHRLFVPSFGGLTYGRSSLDGVVSLCGGAPWLEAPIVAAEGRKGSLCMWWEDTSFAPCCCFLGRTDGKVSFGLERLNLMPFEDQASAEITSLRLAVTSGGWSDAMRPYRDWYTRTFEAELRRRDAVRWASPIRVVVDDFDASDRTLRELASAIDPSTVLLHEWEPRAAAFDTELPEWIPRDGYVEQVLRSKALGFRTMAYVNTYCVNAGSPTVERDGVASFALPRRLAGYHLYGGARAEWSTFRQGELVYLDSLPARWRDYHCASMIEWHRKTRTDANYEDVGSTAGDYGNGLVEGMSGAQGGAAMFRQLLDRNPDVPMASEHSAEHMAFACRWPMRYPQQWGDAGTRRAWMTDLRPVSAFIHGDGSRAWVPTRNAGTEELQVTVAACADAVGGLAQVTAGPGTLRARAGIVSHLMQRAILFSRLQLTPDFAVSVPGDPVACRYRDLHGGIYEYSATPSVQKLTGPDGQVLYQRVTGMTTLETDACISGWPARDGKRCFGLNPDAWYCLGPPQAGDTAVSVSELGDGLAVARYSESRDAVILVVRGLGAVTRGRIGIRSARAIPSATLNDSEVEAPTATGRVYEATLPARFVFALVDPPSPKPLSPISGDPDGRYVASASGIDRGTPYTVPRRQFTAVPGLAEPQVAMMCGGGGDSEIALEFLLRVPDANSSALLSVRNPALRAGNGARISVRLNGREVHAADIAPRGSERNEAWRIPLGAFTGQPVLITLATDGKADDNCDEVWWSRPVLVTDPAQALTVSPIGTTR